MIKFLLVCFGFLAGNFLRAQTTFSIIGSDNLKPFSGFQMQDSSFYLLCTKKQYAPEPQQIILVNLDKHGNQTNQKQLDIPNCGDNYPKGTFLTNKGLFLASGYSMGCVQPMLHFILMLDPLTDSIKYLQYSPNHTTWEGSNHLSQGKSSKILSTYSNKVIIYNDSGKFIQESDSLSFRLFGPVAEYPDSGFIVIGGDTGTIMISRFSSQGNYIISDSIPIGFIPNGNKIYSTNCMLVRNSGDIVINYKKYDPLDKSCLNYIRVLDSNLKLKWEKQIGPKFPYSNFHDLSLLVERKSGFFTFIQQFFKDSFNWNAYDFLYHIDSTGSVNRIDTLLCKTNGIPSLKSAISTLDGGIMITYSCSIPQPIGYLSHYAVLKTDSNHKINYITGIPFQTDPLLKIYPNPFKEEVNVEGLKPGKSYSLILYDILGRELYHKNIDRTVELKTLPGGILYYQLSESGIVIKSGKLVHQQ
jgi:hypothetical protein